MVTIRNLHKSFDGQRVLRGVNLEVAQGEILVVIGRSGEGKSVLLKHLMGLLQPDQGQVLIGGVEITRLQGQALDRVRERSGVVFQGGALFDSLTVYENVAFPLREKTRLPGEAIREKCLSLLKQVGLADMGHKYPAEVSGGMKKRVALARALAMEPEIMLFDEPTTGLDPIMVNAIHRLILDLHRRVGYTAIMVSHEIPEIFGIADRVAMLHKGVVVEEGPPEVIQSSTNPVVRQFISGDPEGPIQPD
ncbi:MAG: ABC transporter ATP-binding protein [candidate division NC10 bacterium]|jgi:phospholipid/cholesterol/gamma-HCH transport system ATP-binding protein|nr:ABC transporter ATP-binding protein [candidate division NC10 bacterium]